MADEQESIAEVEAETPIEQEVEAEQPESLDTTETDDEEQPKVEDQPSEEDEDEEFDWNGKKIKGPKGLKDGVLMHADYTRKTQEVAATRKELEERAQRLDQQFKASDEEMQARAAVMSIDGQLKQYENVDWKKWSADDPIGAHQGYIEYQQLRDARGQVANYLTEQQKTRTEQAEQETVKRLQETAQYAEKNIKGWTPEVDAKITEFATKELGFTWDMLKSAYNPQVYRTLHLAWLGSQALNTKPAAPAPKPAQQPLKVVAAKANPPAVKDLGSMSMEEYAAHRQKQMARRG
jgi:hypothetical protein